MRSKYGARKTVFDGIVFDSAKECRRYQELAILECSGKISGLKLQVPFELIPAMYERTNEIYKSGKKKGLYKKGKCIERAVKYIVDFVYYDEENQKWIAEDVKGVRTQAYIIKRKLFRWRYPDYEFREV